MPADRTPEEIADAIVDGLDNASKTPPIFNAAWLRTAIASAIASAVSENNEACAKIADKEAWRENTVVDANVDHPNVGVYQRGRQIAERIAAAIRSREAAQSNHEKAT